MEGGVTLGYWAIRGLAERLRQLLVFCGIPYTQTLYGGAEGRTKWFTEDKGKLVGKNPAITLPYLIDGDKVVTESDAICVYICYKGNKPELLGRNLDEQVTMATVHGVYKDLHPIYIKLVYGSYNQQNTFENALKEAMKNFEPCLKKLSGILGEKEFIAGGLTWTDFVLADLFQTFSLLHEDILKPFPNLNDHWKRVWALPELKNYFASENFKERPCNNYTAHWK